MSGELAGRRALVTGAGRGIGRAVAVELAAAGAAVAVNYRKDEAAAVEVVRTIVRRGGTAVALRATVGQAEEDVELAYRAVDALGGIDVLVANAGVASQGRTIAESDPAEFERLLQVHALGPLRLVQALIPELRRRARADVVLVSSSEVARMPARGGPYNVAKAALEALGATLAKEEAPHGVRVNVVAPGLVATEMGDRLVRATAGLPGVGALDAEHPLGRVTRPEDVAHLVRFLLSPRTTQVVGQRIVLDGGGSRPA